MSLPRKRLLVAAAFLLVSAGGFVLLGQQSQAENDARTLSAYSYAFAGSEPSRWDSLGLQAKLPALSMLGVSDDGSISGYASELSVRESSAMLLAALVADGWVLQSDDQQGVLSLSRDPDASAAPAGANAVGDEPDGQRASANTGGHHDAEFLLIQCVEAGAGSSIVIKSW